MQFSESLQYLFSLGNEVETMKLGLENITALLAAIGDPQNSYKKVQVAGTNGKGSVCAFLDSICREANIRTGLYTSPHLISITERIKIDGADIREEVFARLATRVRETSEKLLDEGRLIYLPTFFEQITAIALLAFAEANVELAILETGLGGRYDAVTAAKAEIAAITRIDLDHQEYLGDTIEEIAAEKAAIIREDSRVVIGRQEPEIMKILLDRCSLLGVIPRTSCQADVHTTTASGEAVVEFQTTENRTWDAALGLAGLHQVENACTAVLITDLLGHLSDEDIWRGLEAARHPGRLESVQPNFLLDGAHNPGGAAALAKFLQDFHANRPVTLVFGAVRDKAVGEIAAMLWPKAARVILTQPSNSRALTSDELASVTPQIIGADSILKTQTVSEAIEKAMEITPPDGLILVTGSLYLVGEVKKLLNNQ